jgi:hypothetical protein
MPPVGELNVRFMPASKSVSAGDSIWFQAGRFAMDLEIWESQYDVRKLSGSRPDSFLVLVRSHVKSPDGPTIAGYNGPQFHIVAPDPGVYIIRFDSTSAFQADMGDSATFRATPATALRRESPGAAARGDRGYGHYLLNGKRRMERGDAPNPFR